ncbi:hypothetical protein ABIE18_003381 [Arthrobacter sp. 2762]
MTRRQLSAGFIGRYHNTAFQLGGSDVDEISSELGDAVPVPPAGSSSVVEVLGRYALEVHFNRLSPTDAAKKAMAGCFAEVSLRMLLRWRQP